MVLALVVIGIFPAASIYAWQMANKTPENARVKEAEQIAEETFIQVLGENVINRLDKLTLNENSMEVHYTWGIDESDMGHVFDMTVDITSRSIIVTHCR
jgi:hypothetical protein